MKLRKQNVAADKRDCTETLDERIHVSIKQLMRLRHQAREFSYLPSQPVKSVLNGRKRSAIRGRGLDFIELREYRPGDDIRTMDWRVTLRTKAPHVRVYAEEKDRPVMLLVDQRQSMFFGSQWKMKSVIAAEMAALSAWRVLATGDRLGAVLFGDHEIKEFKPSRNQAKMVGLLSKMAEMNQALSVQELSQGDDGDTVSFERILKITEQLISHDALVILISDFIDWSPAALKRLKVIAQHNDVIAGLVYDELEQDLSNADRLVVSDGRYQYQIDHAKSDISARFKKAFDLSLTGLKDQFKKYDIPVLPISTNLPVYEQLVKHLGGRP